MNMILTVAAYLWIGLAPVAGPASAPATAPVMADNPDYLAWKNFPVGTTVTMKMNGFILDDKDKEIKTEGSATARLAELTAEKTVLEFNYEIAEGGKKEKKTDKDEISAKVPKDSLPAAESKGQEDVKIGEKTYKCQWEQIVDKQDKITVTVKKWTSADVPGGSVRQIIKSELDGKVISQTAIELVEFKKP